MYSGITQSGWMFKRGAIVKSDKKRFFTLQGHTLFYFADDTVCKLVSLLSRRIDVVFQMKNPLGSIDLLEYVVENDQSQDKQGSICLRLCHPNKRNYWIWCESSQAIKAWLKAMFPCVLAVNISAEFFF